MTKLTAMTVKSLRHPDSARGTRPARFGDGGGLYLQVTPGGAKSWLLRYMLGGRSREMGLGSADGVTLAAARQRAAELRALLRQGLDPLAERDRADADRAAREAAGRAAPVTFRQAAERHIASREAGWKNAKHRAQWPSTLTTYAYPVLGDMAVAAVDTAAVMTVLDPVWRDKPETASRLRGRIEAVLDYAKVAGWRQGENPARWRGHLAHMLPARGKLARVEHHAALPWPDIGAFMAALRGREATAARALEFTILTAARTGETLGATWREVDLDTKVWTVPGARMKAGRDHRVPLSPPALAVLEEMAAPWRAAGGAPDPARFVFPGGRAAAPLSSMALLMLLRRMGRPELTVHGFRSTFRDWAAEAKAFPRELAEAALAHVLADKTEAAYRRGDMMAKRATMMEAWAAYCAEPRVPAAVIPIRRRETVAGPAGRVREPAAR